MINRVKLCFGSIGFEVLS